MLASLCVHLTAACCCCCCCAHNTLARMHMLRLVVEIIYSIFIEGVCESIAVMHSRRCMHLAYLVRWFSISASKTNTDKSMEIAGVCVEVERELSIYRRLSSNCWLCWLLDAFSYVWRNRDHCDKGYKDANNRRENIGSDTSYYTRNKIKPNKSNRVQALWSIRDALPHHTREKLWRDTPTPFSRLPALYDCFFLRSGKQATRTSAQFELASSIIMIMSWPVELLRAVVNSRRGHHHSEMEHKISDHRF